MASKKKSHTCRDLRELLEQFPNLSRKTAQPPWVAPMLATLTNRPFSDPKWIFECKLDGVRCLAFREGGEVRLLSRNQKNLNNAFPELRKSLAKQACGDFIVDGEIVAFKPDSTVSSFSHIQQRLGINDPKRARARQSRVPVFYFIFDILHVDGHDVTGLPLLDRKELLNRAIQFGGLVHYSEHLKRHGEKFLAEACRQGWEGLIAKRADSRYVHGRSRDWLKFKCVSEQELVIGGYTDPQQSRVGFGAILVGYYDGNKALHFAGGVGTGFTDQVLRELHAQLSKLSQKHSPFVDKLPSRYARTAHWVKPKLVAQIGFTEWTPDGQLRQPRFRGLRSDKSPLEVVREG